MREPRMGRCATCDGRVILLNASMLHTVEPPSVICPACTARFEEMGALVTRAMDWPQGAQEGPPAD